MHSGVFLADEEEEAGSEGELGVLTKQIGNHVSVDKLIIKVI